MPGQEKQRFISTRKRCLNIFRQKHVKSHQRGTAEPSPSCIRVANILTVMTVMMLDYPITGGMQTLYLPSVNAPLPRAKHILLQGKGSHWRRQVILSASSAVALSGAEQRCSRPRAPEFNVIFRLMTKVCLPCVTYCVKDTVYLFHITAPPCNSFAVQLR